MDGRRIRIREPQRCGQEVIFRVWEDSLPPKHPARLIWEVLGRMNLDAFVCGARVQPDQAGRSLVSRRMVLALWGYAFTRGIIHAREIARLLKDNDIGFRWIAADLNVNHSLLSDFLRANGPAIESLFTDVLGALMHQGLLFLTDHVVAQDGTRLQANAGAGSFRAPAALEECRQQAELQLKAILARMDDPPLTERQQAARERGAKEVLSRVLLASKIAGELQERRIASKDKRQQASQARASVTDPEARFMKMPNGGFAPGYNLQLAVVGSPMGGAVAVIGLRVVDLGTDKGSLLYMRDEVQRRTGRLIPSVLVDSDHLTLQELREACDEKLQVISCVPEKWTRMGDPVIDSWTSEMRQEPFKTAYRARKSLVERVNCVFKDTFGIRRVPVRGLRYVLGFCTLAGLMFNIVQFGSALVS
jgi:hypothetical protein